MVSEALWVPFAAGVYNIAIVHLPPAATEAPQVLVCTKLLASVPVSARLAILKVELPVSVRVMDAGLPDVATG
jgi:hypothetical protein